MSPPTGRTLAVSQAGVRGDVLRRDQHARGHVDACRRAGIAPATGGTIVGLYVATATRSPSPLLLELWNADHTGGPLAERDAAASQ